MANSYDRFEKFCQSCGGAVHVYHVDVANARAMLMAVRADERAQACLQSVVKFLIKVRKMMPPRGVSCLFCDHQFNASSEDPYGMVVVMPEDKIHSVLVSGICEECHKQEGPNMDLIKRFHELWPATQWTYTMPEHRTIQ